MLLIGDPALEFIVHKDLLIHFSGYFRAAYNSNMSEAQSNTFTLGDEEPDLFRSLNR